MQEVLGPFPMDLYVISWYRLNEAGYHFLVHHLNHCQFLLVFFINTQNCQSEIHISVIGSIIYSNSFVCSSAVVGCCNKLGCFSKHVSAFKMSTFNFRTTVLITLSPNNYYCYLQYPMKPWKCPLSLTCKCWSWQSVRSTVVLSKLRWTANDVFFIELVNINLRTVGSRLIYEKGFWYWARGFWSIRPAPALHQSGYQTALTRACGRQDSPVSQAKISQKHINLNTRLSSTTRAKAMYYPLPG